MPADMPALMDEAIVARDQLLPEWIISQMKLPRFPLEEDEDDYTYMEKYENDLATIHEYIDKLCSTDLVKEYAPDAKAIRREGGSSRTSSPSSQIKTKFLRNYQCAR